MPRRISVIGRGPWAQNIIRELKELGAEVPVVASRDRGWNEAIDCKPDGVVLAADPAINLAVILAADEAGIPVFAEKPLGLSLKDVELMQAVKVPVVVDYTYIFSPQYEDMRSAVGGLKLKAIESCGFGPRGGHKSSTLYDFVSHDLSIVFGLMSGCHIRSVQHESHNLDKLHNVILVINDTLVGIVSGVPLRDVKGRLVRVYDGSAWHCVDFDLNSREPLRNAVKHFLRVLDGEKPFPGLDFALRVHKALDKIERANVVS